MMNIDDNSYQHVHTSIIEGEPEVIAYRVVIDEPFDRPTETFEWAQAYYVQTVWLIDKIFKIPYKKVILITSLIAGFIAIAVGISIIVDKKTSSTTTSSTTTLVPVDCDVVCDQDALDLVFLVDSSASIGTENFPFVRQGLAKMVEELNVGPQNVRVGIVQYDTQVFVRNTLADSDQQKSNILTIIQNLPFTAGQTATGKALQQARLLFQASPRPFVPKLVVIITDGRTNAFLNINPRTVADALKSDGVDIFAVGVGDDISESELLYLASDPKSFYRKNYINYPDLLKNANVVTSTTCAASSFININEVARIQSAQNELRRFQLDLTKLTGATTIEIETTVYQGAVGLSYSLDTPLDTCAAYATPSAVRTNGDGSRTYTWRVSPIASTNKRLYVSVRGIAAGTNIYDLKLRQI